MFPPYPAIFPAAGGAWFYPNARKGIRFVRYGCTNRPFYHIVVNHLRRNQFEQPIEQLGTFDPMLNHKGEHLVAVNIERLQYWIGEGALVSVPCAELLGLAGILPIHPTTYMRAWRARKKLVLEELEKVTANEKGPSEEKQS